MEKDLRIKITVDKNTGSLKVINSEFDNLDTKVNKTDKSFGTLKGSIAGLATAAVGIYAVEKALESVMKSGFSFNKELEESKAGLVSLSVAVQDKTIPVLDRYNAANVEATNTLKELQRINSQTPHSLNETNKIYKAMYVSMKNAGASTSDMIELTRSLSIASGAAGIEFNSLLAGVDGLATGTVLVNSDLGRFLSSLGLTNEKLKESDDVVKLLKNTLKDFKAADTMSVALSNLGNSWDTLTGKITEDSFLGAKAGLNTLSDLINKMSDEDISHARDMMNGFSISAITAVYGVSYAVAKLKNGFEELGTILAGSAFLIEHGGLKIFLSDEESKALDNMYEKTRNNVDATNKFIESLEKSKNALISTINETDKFTKSQREWKKELDNISFIGVDDSAINAVYKAIDDQYNYEIESKKLSNSEKLQLDKEYAKKIEDLNKKVLSGYENKSKSKTSNKDDDKEKSLQKQIDLNEKLYKQYIDITGTDYDKWALKTSEIISELGKSTELTTDQFVKLGDELSKSKPLPSLGDYGIKTDNKYADDKIKQDEDKKAAEKDYYDFIDSRMQDQLDMQIALAESAQDWTNSLSGTAGQIADISKAMNAFYVADLKGQKNENKIYNDYGKEFVKLNKQKEDGLISQYELDTKTKKLQQDQDKEIAKTKEATNNAEIRAYADLAGAMASSYEQGSSGAVAFAAVQSALGIASSWTAIANAWAQPFPANIAAAAMVASQVMPIIGQLGGSGGASQSVSYSEQRQSDYETKSEDYEDSMQPVLDRLDRQIDLLESIDGYEGKALAANLKKDNEQYIVDLTTASIKDFGLLDTTNKFISIDHKEDYYGYTYEEASQIYRDFADNMNSYVDGSVNFSIVDFPTKQSDFFKNSVGESSEINFNESVLEEGNNLVKFLLGYKKEDYDLAFIGLTEDEYEQIMNDSAEASNEFATSVLDGMQELIDMADDFKNTYDDLTDSNKYYIESLKEANSKVSAQAGSSSLDEYLQEQIDNIALLENKLSPENIDLLLSDDENDLIAQMDLTASLSDDLTTALNNGALEALNMKDDIDLLAEAMINSSDNIKSFKDSFKSDDELLSDMASDLSYDEYTTHTFGTPNGMVQYTTTESIIPEVVTTYDELSDLFDKLSGGIDGLTDSELEFLNANKDLIDQTQDIYEDVLGGWIDSLEDASQRIQDTADDLRGVSYAPTLSDYYSSMSETTSLLNAGDYDSFLKSLDNTIDLTSVLKDSSNFNSEQDMEFNQLVAANQFDNLNVNVGTELDVLKQIAEDTSKSYQAQQDTLDIQIQQANEIVKMRKEIEDLRAEMVA